MTCKLSPAAKRIAACLCVLSAGIVLSAALTDASAQVPCPQQDSLGPPAVHNQHIFCGEINKKSRATGFHSRPGGQNPNSVSNTGDPVIPDDAPDGIYLLYGFDITQGGRTRTKTLSTMFPDACSKDDVLAAIRNAAAQGAPGKRFNGMSGQRCQAGGAPFAITGFLDKSGNVITAWPDFGSDQ